MTQSSILSNQNENKSMILDLRFVLTLSVRVLLTWIVLSLLFFIIGKYLISFLLPYFTLLMNTVTDSYSSALSIKKIDGSVLIHTSTLITQPIYIASYPVSPSGATLNAGTNLVHSLVPFVIYYTAVLCWPNTTYKERIVLCLLGIPVLLLIMSISVPALLIGHIEAALLNAAEDIAKRQLSTPFVMQWVIFLESGGRWLFPLVGAMVCKMISRTILSSKAV